ncbi:MAG: TonB-dependent receptor [Myxococcales bacterium]|nr:TonB-dependent receptor [Myxococcales bacterium]
MIGLCLGALAAPLSGARRARADEAPPLEVDVRGDALPRAGEPTTPSTSVEADDLHRPGQSVAGALARVPGVMIARTGGASELTTMTLRGASSAQTPVYLAGVRLNDELYRAADLSTIPSFFLRRVDVYRGHAPIELDRTGLGGAVLLEPEVPVGTRVAAGLGAGSFASRSYFGAASFGTEAAAAALSVRRDATRGDFSYVDDRGTRFDASDDREVRRQNADAASLDAWAALRVRLGERGTWSSVVNVFSREQGTPGLGVIPAELARSTSERALVASRLSVACGEDPTDACTVAASTFAKRTRYVLDDPNLELPFGSTRQVVTTTSTGGQVAWADAPLDWLDTRVGVGHAVEGLTVDPIGPAESDAQRFSARAFGDVAVRPLDWLELRAAAALSSERTEATSNDGLALVPSARVGAAARATSWLTAFAAAGYYTRTPSLGELYGASASFLGNPSLVAEAGPSADVGTRASAKSRYIDVGAELVFFGRLASDLIEYKRSAAGTVRPYNVGSARFLGAEALAAAEIVDMVELDASLAFNDARDTSEDRQLTNDRLPFQAPLVATAGAALDLDELGSDDWMSGARIGATFLYRSQRFADPAGLITLPSQVMLDADAGVRLVHDTLRFDVRVMNVLGDVTTDLVGYPLPGRAFFAELSGEWK